MSIDAGRAARRIVEAARRGDAELTITAQAKIAAWANALAPSLVAAAMDVVNRLLPAACGEEGNARHGGWQSTTRWSPSWLTRLSDRAADRNSQRPARERVGAEGGSAST